MVRLPFAATIAACSAGADGNSTRQDVRVESGRWPGSGGPSLDLQSRTESGCGERRTRKASERRAASKKGSRAAEPERELRSQAPAPAKSAPKQPQQLSSWYDHVTCPTSYIASFALKVDLFCPGWMFLSHRSCRLPNLSRRCSKLWTLRRTSTCHQTSPCSCTRCIGAGLVRSAT